MRHTCRSRRTCALWLGSCRSAEPQGCPQFGSSLTGFLVYAFVKACGWWFWLCLRNSWNLSSKNLNNMRQRKSTPPCVLGPCLSRWPSPCLLPLEMAPQPIWLVEAPKYNTRVLTMGVIGPPRLFGPTCQPPLKLSLRLFGWTWPRPKTSGRRQVSWKNGPSTH